MSARRPDCDPEEFAELHAAGALDGQEQAHLERLRRAGDNRATAAWRRLQGVTEALLESVSPVAPSVELSRAILDRIRTQGAPRAAPAAPPAFAAAAAVLGTADPLSQDAAAMVVLRAADLDWNETEVPGVHSRNLFVDSASGRLTLLIRMDAGARYPNHEHHGVEECMVIDGDLHIAGTVLHAHDYLRTPRGGDHGSPWTEGGCLLLVTVPLAA